MHGQPRRVRRLGNEAQRLRGTVSRVVAVSVDALGVTASVSADISDVRRTGRFLRDFAAAASRQPGQQESAQGASSEQVAHNYFSWVRPSVSSM